jgi:hypothetical protein
VEEHGEAKAPLQPAQLGGGHPAGEVPLVGGGGEEVPEGEAEGANGRRRPDGVEPRKKERLVA